MKAKVMKWPKWTDQYEDIKRDKYRFRRITGTDRAWNWIDDTCANLISAIRNLARKRGLKV